MRKKRPFDLEMAEAVTVLLGLIVVAFAMVFGAVALTEWAVGW